MNKIGAAFIGIAVASLAPAIAFGIFLPLSNEQDLVSSLGVMPIIYVITLLSSLVLGGPLLYLFNKFKMINLATSLICGGAIGICGAFILRAPNPPLTKELYLFGITGIVSGFIFGLIWHLNNKPVTLFSDP